MELSGSCGFGLNLFGEDQFEAAETLGLRTRVAKGERLRICIFAKNRSYLEGHSLEATSIGAAKRYSGFLIGDHDHLYLSATNCNWTDCTRTSATERSTSQPARVESSFNCDLIQESFCTCSILSRSHVPDTATETGTCSSSSPWPPRSWSPGRSWPELAVCFAFFARGLAESCVFVWNGGGRRKQLKQTEPAAEEVVEEDHTVSNRLEPRSLKIFFEVRGEEQRVRGTVQFGGVIFGHEKRNEIEGKFVCFNENVVLRQNQRNPVN